MRGVGIVVFILCLIAGIIMFETGDLAYIGIGIFFIATGIFFIGYSAHITKK